MDACGLALNDTTTAVLRCRSDQRQGSERSYDCDAAGRLIRSTNPETVEYTYVDKGRPRTDQADGAGGFAEWSYDASGRVEQLLVSDPVEPTGEAAYT